MKSIKRILALLMAFAIVLCLGACGGGGGNDTSGGDGVDYLETASEKQVALFGDLKGTKLRVADDVDMMEWEENFYKQLEEETGMKVEIEPMSSSELGTKIAQAVASGDKRNYFDVGICANSGLLNLIYANIATPMDDYIYYDDPVWKYSEAADFNCLDLYKVNDHFWGAPSHGFHENFIFYNKTYFEEMQAPDPYTEYYLKDNWTFETFMDTCEAVTKKNADGSVDVAAWATWNYFTFLSAAGNDMIAQDPDDPERWEIVYDQPNGMAGLNVLYECAKNGWLNTKTSGYQDFVNRKVAMLIEKPSSAMGSTEAYTRMSDEIGMIPFPKMNAEQEKYICPMIVSGYYIPSCAQNPAGAAAYIYYHRIGEQMRDKSEWGIENIRTRMLNDEAQERRNEYIAKCDFAVPWVDGLAGWYNENRSKFLQIMWDGTNPAAAADQMKPLLNDSLRRTVG